MCRYTGKVDESTYCIAEIFGIYFMKIYSTEISNFLVIQNCIASEWIIYAYIHAIIHTRGGSRGGHRGQMTPLLD